MDTEAFFQPEQERAAALREMHPHYRVIRTLPPLDHLPLAVARGEVRKAVIVDCETTGLTPGCDRIIELAALPIWFDDRGRIVRLGTLQTWLEDPGEPLSPEIVRLTGLADTDLTGRAFDDRAIVACLGDADLLIAHNALFDAPFCEARFSGLADIPWACSLREIDWQRAGYPTARLGDLLQQACGFFHTGHRAAADVEALAWLLASSMPDQHGALRELIETSARETVRVEALGAPFAVKDALKNRGYRWHGTRRVWWKDIDPTDLWTERAWLIAAAACNRPVIIRLDARVRHR